MQGDTCCDTIAVHALKISVSQPTRTLTFASQPSGYSVDQVGALAYFASAAIECVGESLAMVIVPPASPAGIVARCTPVPPHKATSDAVNPA
jgi:hypothetical protein